MRGVRREEGGGRVSSSAWPGGGGGKGGGGAGAAVWGACRHLQSASAGQSRKGEEDGATGSWGRELQGTRQQEQQQGGSGLQLALSLTHI